MEIAGGRRNDWELQLPQRVQVMVQHILLGPEYLL